MRGERDDTALFVLYKKTGGETVNIFAEVTIDETGIIKERTGETEMNNAETLNQYIKELFDYWNGKNDDFESIPIPKEVDDEMQRDSFY